MFKKNAKHLLLASVLLSASSGFAILDDDNLDGIQPTKLQTAKKFGASFFTPFAATSFSVAAVNYGMNRLGYKDVSKRSVATVLTYVASLAGERYYFGSDDNWKTQITGEVFGAFAALGFIANQGTTNDSDQGTTNFNGHESESGE